MTKSAIPEKLTISGDLSTSTSTSTNSNTKAEVVVKELPRLSIDSPTDVVSVLSFLITALVVLGTTWLTIRNYQKTIDLQDRIARSSQELETTKTRVEILSKNRQDWINTLRNALSEYIAVMLSIVELRELRKALDTDLSRLSHSENVDGTAQWNYKLLEARTTASQLRAKITLLANPREEDFVTLIDAIERLHAAVDAKKKSISQEVDQLIEASQKILKTEWERVKNIQ